MAKLGAKSNNPNGRPKGSTNQQTKDIEAKLKAMGCDPIVGMARIALDCEKELQILDDAIANTSDVSEKSACIRAKNTHINSVSAIYKELAQYVAPKRKAVEHTGDVDSTITIKWK